MEPIVPKSLQKGDKIAVISPSARFNHVFPNCIRRGTEYLQRQGYHVEVIYDETAPSTFQEDVQQRLREFHSAFKDPEVKAIICAMGGATSNELLRHVDWDVIRANPKIFVGYSDITVLHCAIFAQTGLQTFYGPMILEEFGGFVEPVPFIMDHFFHVVSDSNATDKPVGIPPRSKVWSPHPAPFFEDPSSTEPQKFESAPGWKWLRSGKCQGRIFGGCFNSLMRLRATPYWPGMKGRVLIIETSGGEGMNDPWPLEEFRAALADLGNMGVWDQIVGLVVGRPFGIDDATRPEWEKTLTDLTEGTEFPILANVDVGHTAPILTIPLNGLVELDFEADRMEFLEPSVQG